MTQEDGATSWVPEDRRRNTRFPRERVRSLSRKVRSGQVTRPRGGGSAREMPQKTRAPRRPVSLPGGRVAAGLPLPEQVDLRLDQQQPRHAARRATISRMLPAIPGHPDLAWPTTSHAQIVHGREHAFFRDDYFAADEAAVIGVTARSSNDVTASAFVHSPIRPGAVMVASFAVSFSFPSR